MWIDDETRVAALLGHDGLAAEAVLRWYGLDVPPAEPDQTLLQACAAHQVDLADVIVDLRARLDDAERETG
jgi:hypothetical protein